MGLQARRTRQEKSKKSIFGDFCYQDGNIWLKFGPKNLSWGAWLVESPKLSFHPLFYRTFTYKP